MIFILHILKEQRSIYRKCDVEFFYISIGERPFKCQQCDRAFNQKGALRIHMSKHTGLKPHPCDFCPMSFAQRGNLRAHIQVSSCCQHIPSLEVSDMYMYYVIIAEIKEVVQTSVSYGNIYHLFV